VACALAQERSSFVLIKNLRSFSGGGTTPCFPLALSRKKPRLQAHPHQRKYWAIPANVHARHPASRPSGSFGVAFAPPVLRLGGASALPQRHHLVEKAWEKINKPFFHDKEAKNLNFQETT